jgi:hypothetical protein
MSLAISSDGQSSVQSLSLSLSLSLYLSLSAKGEKKQKNNPPTSTPLCVGLREAGEGEKT